MVEFKYIMMEWKGRRVPIIFPTSMVHSIVLQAMRAYATEEAKLLGNPDWVAPKAVSAGIVQIDVEDCYDKSDTLGLAAGEGDANTIRTYPYTHGLV